MSNSDLLKGIESIDRRGYKTYLRVKSIEKVFGGKKVDKSFGTFQNSKWGSFSFPYQSYVQYSISNVEECIAYTEYISSKCYIDTTDGYTYTTY